MQKIKKSMSVALFVLTISLASLMFVFPVSAASPPLLDPTTIPKWVNQLTSPPPVYVPTVITDEFDNVIRHEYTIEMRQRIQQILPPGYFPTLVWGYGGLAEDALTGADLGFVLNSPGPSFEAVRGIPIKVTWVNNIYNRHLFTIDPTLHWANPNNMMMPTAPFRPYQAGYAMAQWPVPLTPHLHGGEILSGSDGGPETWFTWNGIHGPDYSTYEPTAPNSAVFYYHNTQQPTTLWYHDHALGITRLNVMSGLAGFYLLRDPGDMIAPLLPSGKYEMPIVIQDRIFTKNGQMFFPGDGVNPDVHPYWEPEFFGNTIMVNGLVWPNMNVDQGQYRFRFLEGSNARFYTLSFRVDGDLENPALPFIKIGTDGGYLREAVELTEFTFAPGQRVDLLFDFSEFEPGTKIILRNTANSPFPNGDPVDPNTTGQIIQFTVTDNAGPEPANLPDDLNPTLPVDGWPTLPGPDKTRMLPFFEEMSAIDEPLGVFLNGQKWAGVITELPEVGTTEDWWLINPTEDAHPIHTHLTQFQVVYRIPFDAVAYQAAWEAVNGPAPVPVDTVPTEVSVLPFLTGPPVAPSTEEMGWFDTTITPPGWVTVIRIRYASQDGTPYPFDATSGPGYVWHCHILEHEDNEMMRPYKVVSP
jgi:FtsP/CotA-like multicopper oxidase with cupredoxin domain